jgi:hypothetical protein
MLADEGGRLVADVEMDIVQAQPLDLMVDRARHDVARGQFGARVEVGHEAVPGLGDSDACPRRAPPR